MSTSTALRIVQKYHPNVTRVVDATRDTHVKVTQHDCDKSKSKAPNSCAMATAFKKKHDGAIVSLAVAYLIDGNTAVRYRVPAAVSREIISFDRAKMFAPGFYKLTAPVSTEKLAVIRTKNRSHEQRTGKPIRRVHKTAGIRSL